MLEIFSIIVDITGILGLIITILSWFYNNKLGFFIFINKFLNFNKDVNFKLSFSTRVDQEKIQKYVDIFKKSPEEFEMISRTGIKQSFKYNSMLVTISNSQIVDDEESNLNELFIEIECINSTYNKSRKLLYEACKKLYSISELKDNNLENQTIVFSSKFPKRNPFIGQSVSRIGISKLKHFMMVVNMTTIDKNNMVKDDVIINKDILSFTTKNIHDVEKVAEYVLAL